MRNGLYTYTLKAVLILLVLPTCFVASSQKKASDTPNSSSVKLIYHFPADKPVKYLNVSKVVQTMDINGQSMLVNVSSVLACDIKGTGTKDKNLILEIRVDSMAQNIETPQGNSGGVITDATGKVFSMIITPEGKETDLTAAKNIAINIEGSGQSDLSQSFSGFFPDMPAGSITPGYTWTTTDSLNSKTQSMSMKMFIKAENKLEGFENVGGLNCAKISSVLAGTRDMNTQTQGMDVFTNGTFTGSGILYFAVSEGYFVKQTVITKMTGTIDIRSQNMQFPVVMDMTSTNEVIKP